MKTRLLFLLLIVTLPGCNKPLKPLSGSGEPEASAPPVESTEIEPAKDPPSPPATAVAEKPAPSPPPEPPPEPVDPILDVVMKSDKILITGHLQSRYQERDIIRILSDQFPDHEVVSELDTGQHVRTAGGWANRVTDLLVPLFQEVENPHFRFEGGITTIEGTVKDDKTRKAIFRATGYVMEDFDSRGIEDKLEVVE